MRSHFDAVTCVTFHPLDDVLVSGSEDSTIKLWSIQKSSQTKKYRVLLKINYYQFSVGQPLLMWNQHIHLEVITHQC